MMKNNNVRNNAMLFIVPVHIVLSLFLSIILLNANNTLEQNGRWVFC